MVFFKFNIQLFICASSPFGILSALLLPLTFVIGSSVAVQVVSPHTCPYSDKILWSTKVTTFHRPALINSATLPTRDSAQCYTLPGCFSLDVLIKKCRWVAESHQIDKLRDSVELIPRLTLDKSISGSLGSRTSEEQDSRNTTKKRRKTSDQSIQICLQIFSRNLRSHSSISQNIGVPQPLHWYPKTP